MVVQLMSQLVHKERGFVINVELNFVIAIIQMIQDQDNLEKLLLLEKEYNKVNVFENKNNLNIDDLPKWKQEKIRKIKEKLKNI